jgi:hypothetical protein
MLDQVKVCLVSLSLLQISMFMSNYDSKKGLKLQRNGRKCFAIKTQESEISGFRRDVEGVSSLLGCYAASSGNPFPLTSPLDAA